MRYSMFILLLTVIFIWGCAQEKKEQAESQANNQMNMTEESGHMMPMDSTSGESIAYYTCPMEEHKHIHSAEPGKCPECNMSLVPVIKTTKEKAEYYGCTMEEDSHVRSDKPGNCPECGMPLQAMRLDKNKSMNM